MCVCVHALLLCGACFVHLILFVLVRLARHTMRPHITDLLALGVHRGGGVRPESWCVQNSLCV